MDSLARLITDIIPTPAMLLSGGPAALLWALGALYLSGSLKRHRRWKTGYTRKVFHFLIFSCAALVSWRWGLPGVCLFGGMTPLVILYALIRGDGHLLYEGIAREKDAPYRTHYIVMPYLATLLGGIAANLLFGPAAMIGYLVTGVGDAIGEPVGTRFGRHEYAVPSFRKIKSTRSLEGSAAVFGVSYLALLLGIGLLSPDALSLPVLGKALPIALACALAEAVSPHGWDNATLQILPAYLVTVLMV